MNRSHFCEFLHPRLSFSSVVLAYNALHKIITEMYSIWLSVVFVLYTTILFLTAVSHVLAYNLNQVLLVSC